MNRTRRLLDTLTAMSEGRNTTTRVEISPNWKPTTKVAVLRELEDATGDRLLNPSYVDVSDLSSGGERTDTVERVKSIIAKFEGQP